MNLTALLAVAIVVAILAQPVSAAERPPRDEVRFLGFEPAVVEPSKREVQQQPAVEQVAPGGQSEVPAERPSPSNARIIISILSLVISTVIMYFWAKSLRKKKDKPSANSVMVPTSPQSPKVVSRFVALRIGIAATCLATLFPPFYFQGAGGSRFGLGFSFILLPPRTGAGSAYYGSIDGLALLAIIAGIALVMWISDRIARDE